MDSFENNERGLFKRIANGEEPAYRALFDQWWDKVFTTAFIFSKSKIIASDVAQDVFLAVWQQRSTLAGIDNPAGYLHTMARNIIFRRLARLDLETAYQNYVRSTIVDTDGTGAEKRVIAKQLQAAIEEGIRLLPPQQQQAFRLSREQGMTHEQIATEMGISRGSVKDYIVRAIAFIRKYLQKNELMLWVAFCMAIR